MGLCHRYSYVKMTGVPSVVVFFLVITVAVATRSYFKTNSMSISDLLNPNHASSTPETWTGKYFPTAPPSHTPAPTAQHGGVPMGLNPNCDDARTNLTVDWDFSSIKYTCYHKIIFPDINVKPTLDVEPVPKQYSAVHYCMNETIVYQNPVPTFGPHRPAWPRYGEYKYVPVQRWLHSLEHGGLVMLYHPCAHPIEVERLRKVVKACLFRHVISPSQHLSFERPLALVTWGKRLTMSTVNVDIVREFIQQNALQGPEKISRDGQYDAELLRAADLVSDSEDTYLCPNQNLKALSLFW